MVSWIFFGSFMAAKTTPSFCFIIGQVWFAPLCMHLYISGWVPIAAHSKRGKNEEKIDEGVMVILCKSRNICTFLLARDPKIDHCPWFKKKVNPVLCQRWRRPTNPLPHSVSNFPIVSNFVSFGNYSAAKFCFNKGLCMIWNKGTLKVIPWPWL